MFFSFLKKVIKYGKLDIIDYDQKKYSFGSDGDYCLLKFHDKNLKKRLFVNPELALGEAYVNKDFTIEEGELETLIRIATKNYSNLEKNSLYKIFYYINHLFDFFQKTNILDISKKNVAHHYDINEEIYKLFLDKDMQYSCGYFHNDNVSLEQAQIDKKNHLIKKLNINRKNLKVLDIGCGWGGMALQIAKDTGAHVKGITLSKNQHETAIKRCKELNLDSIVDFELTDYRNINEKYDRIISVGMFEHVGKEYFNEFFKKIKNILTDDGIMVLHSIGSKSLPYNTNSWIKKYIFPGGYIPSISEVVNVIEREDLWINDLEILRLHYANTIKHWHNNFKKNKEKIANILDDRFCRMWEFYLLVSEYSFRNMGNMVFQMQITKNQESLPFTRNYMYN